MNNRIRVLNLLVLLIGMIGGLYFGLITPRVNADCVEIRLCQFQLFPPCPECGQANCGFKFKSADLMPEEENQWDEFTEPGSNWESTDLTFHGSARPCIVVSGCTFGEVCWIAGKYVCIPPNEESTWYTWKQGYEDIDEGTECY